MSDHYDRVREELSDILDKLQEIYRVDNPNDVVLYAAGNQSSTSQDVATVTSSLASQQDTRRSYNVYLHNVRTGNRQFGQLDIQARRGQIDISFTKLGKQEEQLRFRMNVDSDLVLNYELMGPDGRYRPHYIKPMIISALTTLSPK